MNKKLAIISLMSVILLNPAYGNSTPPTASYSKDSSETSLSNNKDINVHSKAKYSNFTELDIDVDAEDVVLPPAKTVDNWTNFSMISPNDNNFIINSKLSRNISRKLKNKVSIAAQPIIIDDHIFILDNGGTISNYDLVTWKLLWSKKLETRGPFTDKRFSNGSILYNEGKLYVAYGSSYMVVLNAADGKEIFSKKFADIVKAAPLIYDNQMIVLTANNQLHCIDLEEGNTIWPPYQAMPPLFLNNWSIVSPIIYNNEQIISSFSPEEIISINVRKGNKLWSCDLNEEYMHSLERISLSTIVAQPIIHNDTLYVTSDFVIGAYDLTKKSKLKWHKHIDGIGNMNLIGNTLFVSTNDSRLIAINADSGKVVWITRLWPIDKIVRKQNESSAKYNMRRFIHSIKTIFKSKATSYILSPVIINNNLLVINNKKLFFIDPYDGSLVRSWSIKTNPQYFAISGDKLYIFRDHEVSIRK